MFYYLFFICISLSLSFSLSLSIYIYLILYIYICLSNRTVFIIWGHSLVSCVFEVYRLFPMLFESI